MNVRQSRGLRAWAQRAVGLAAAAPFVLLAACASGTSNQASGPGTAAAGSTSQSTTVPSKPCDTSVNPVGYYKDAELAGTLSDDHAGMGHGQTTGTMDHGNMPGMDHSKTGTSAKPMDMSGGLGEADSARLMVKLASMSDAEYNQWLESLNPNRSSGSPDDTGMGGHLGPQTWTHVTDQATCAKLMSELETAKTVAAKYPKASDAIAAGYARVAPYVPGIASHWMKFSLVDDKFDVTQPEMLLYDGNEATSNLVGLSYYMRADGEEEPKEGFTGGNDHYHRHQGLCVGRTGVIGDSTTTEEECAAIGGRKQSGANGWMSHAWIVKGCESPWGVFSAQNPLLDRPLVDSSGQGAPCSGSEVAKRWDLSPAPG